MQFSKALEQFVKRFLDPQDRTFHDFALAHPQLATASLPKAEASVVNEMLKKSPSSLTRPSSAGWWW
jgi:hypothetical protein